MRVKFLIALAIASVLLFCSVGIAAASTGIATAEELTAAANNEIANFGFPDFSGIDAVGATDVGIVDSVDTVGLDSCGVCGKPIPDCTCVDTTTVIPGPQVNLGCPIVVVDTVPVNLVSPIIRPVFPAINVAPKAFVTLPQVNTQLNCFDIACQPVTNINECPTAKPTYVR